jgi:hypothetical protein
VRSRRYRKINVSQKTRMRRVAWLARAGGADAEKTRREWSEEAS